jgi:putative flippase GtrA
MIKDFFCYLWEKKFLQYSIVGSSAFILDFATLIILKESFSLNPIVAVAINQILVINYVFFFNKYWSFECEGQTMKQMIKFLILMLGNYVFAVIWMWFFTHLISFSWEINLFGRIRDLWYLVVRLMNILLAVSWNFLIYKYWVYKKENLENKNPTA